jgi:hypothetical protein
MDGQPEYYDIYGVANTLNASLIPLRMSWTKHDNGHPHKRNQRTRHIPGRGPDTLDGPEPEHRHKNVDTSVRGVGAACGCRMEREQPCKQRKACGSGHKKPRALALLEPEIRQIATDDFGNCRSHEKKEGF